MSTELNSLRAAVCNNQRRLRERWIAALVDRTWGLEQQTATVEQLQHHCDAILDAFAHTLNLTNEMALGTPQWREPLRLWSFCSGWMGGAGLPISAALALASGLRVATGGIPNELYDNLLLVAAEAYSRAAAQQAVAAHRGVIEKAQVVCLIADRLPALFLVGDPHREAIQTAEGRLLMLALMRDAKQVVIDAAGLVAPAESLPLALGLLAQQPHNLSRLILTSVPPSLSKTLQSPPPRASWSSIAANIQIADELSGVVAEHQRAAP